MATNDFLPFAASGGANVESQAAYIADSTILANGFVSGIAPSVKLNKVWRQSSIIAAVIGQLSVDMSGANSTDDGTTATILANLKKLIGGRALPHSWLNNDYLQLQSGIIIQWASGTSQGASGNQVITLPIAFPNAQLKSFVCSLYASSAQNGTYALLTFTTTNVTVVRSNTDNGNGVTPFVFSIGY